MKFQFDAAGLVNKAASNALAQFAIAKKDELIASGEMPTSYVKYVDKQKDADEFTVKPEGTIEYYFNIMPSVALYAYEAARGRYPLMGISLGGIEYQHYRDSFFIAVNGVVFRPDWFPDIPMNAELVLCNFAPYARKLDVGMIGTKPMKLSVPPGMMEDVAMLVNRKFNSVKAHRVYNYEFEFNRYTLRKSSGSREAGGHVQSPAVVITSKG